MPRQSTPCAVATLGIDIGKNTFHLLGLDQRGAIVLQLKSSREQLERRLSNLPRCLIAWRPVLARTIFVGSSKPLGTTCG
jgi:hypothetical protein